MSFQVFFSLSPGLSKPLQAPTGTLAAITDHVLKVEAILKLEREQYCWTDADGAERKNPVHWKSTDLSKVEPEPNRRLYDGGILDFSDGHSEWSWNNPDSSLYDDLVCATAEWHNRWVRRLYEDFRSWSETPVADGEELTPEEAQEFWHALTFLESACGSVDENVLREEDGVVVRGDARPR